MKPAHLIRWTTLLVCLTGGIAGAAERVEFENQVRRVLSENCFQCHGPDARARQAELRLDRYTDQLTDPERHIIVPGKPGKSELIQRITAGDPELRMPPPGSEKQLDQEQRALLIRWVKQGAVFSQHWSLTPPQSVPAPSVRQKKWPHNPVDHFILARLEQERIKPSPRAAPEVLVRRLFLDLTGLPPTLPELDQYLAAPPGSRYAALVDKLLDSSAFGEQMAWHWLEAARYSDTNGYQGDRTRIMWPWRDWVIAAFNENVPFDRFTIEQLAGDLLDSPDSNQLIASGFNRNHPLNGEGGRIPEENRVEYVFDRVETTSTVWMGLTVGCARCHDHKFDDITQREYYQLYAYFNNIDESGSVDKGGNANPVASVTPPALGDQEASEATIETMVMRDRAEPRATYRLEIGRYDKADKSEQLFPGVPASLPELDEDAPSNRLALARWLVSDQHPLTARVAVNRIWQLFFGSGLVRTSEDFGSQGERPSHPKLLDWLAVSYRDSGWDTKQLIRLLLNSATYQQSSRIRADLLEQDPYNRLLARAPRYRLPSHVIRDQALFMSGLLHSKMGGPSVKPYQPAGLWADFSFGKITYSQDSGESLYRRSLYTFWRRSLGPPNMFDEADRKLCSVRSARTNTPLHALTLLNDMTFVEASRVFAEKMIASHDSVEERLSTAFRIAVCRRPTGAELEVLTRAHAAALEHFIAEPDDAALYVAIGAQPMSSGLDRIEVAALGNVLSMILNTDEALTRE